MSPTILTILTFGAGVTAVAGVYSLASDLYLRDRKRVAERIVDEFRDRHRERAKKSLLFKDLGVPDLDPEADRVMICGSPGMLRDLKHMIEARGFAEGNTSTPGAFVIERAFAEQ